MSHADTLPVLLFAAGFGTRMGLLTAEKPKPLVQAGGQALLDHALAIVDQARARPIVVNLHYRGDQIRQHLAHRDDIRFSEEQPDILETGGGLRQAGGLLGAEIVQTLNTDAIWTGQNPLTQLMAAWDAERMDGLLLLLPAEQATGHAGKGDFAIKPDGTLTRGTGDETHIYLGAQIINASKLKSIQPAAFSLNLVWNQMIAQRRLFGLAHKGGWCDVGHPAAIPLAEAMLKDNRA
jgi:N-acetyl-alpha-D-muramate 1-phosphate uridylyltransferase